MMHDVLSHAGTRSTRLLSRRGLRFFLALAVAACTRANESEAAQTRSVGSQPTSRGAETTASRRTAITRAVAKVAPAVVTVQTEGVERVAPGSCGWFFGGGRADQRAVPGLGCGFTVRPDGIGVTHAH